MKLKQLISLTLFIGFLSGLYAKEDVINIKGRGELEVLVVKEDRESVTFKDLTTGASQKIKAEDVISLIYKDAHVTLERAIQGAIANDWQFCAKNILAAKKAQKSSNNNWHVFYISYYTSKSLSELSKVQPSYAKNAEAYFKNFIKTGAKSRFYDHAHLDLADLYIRLKRFDEARKTLTSLEKSTKSQHYKNLAKSEVAKSYLYEGDAAKAIEVGMGLLRGGVITEGLVEVFSIALVDKGRKYDQAYKIASSLVGKSKDAGAMKKVHELKGCAAFHLKKYGEGLEDLLKSQLLYGEEASASSRLKIYLASTIHVLMKLKPSEYGQWEYNTPYIGLRKGFNVSEGKVFQKLVQKL